MTNQINQIVEHLFHKARLDDVSVYELERFIATHPYFAAGHFLLAKKTQQADPPKAHETIATTSLYYNNPLWLQWLLDQDISTTEKNIGLETNGAGKLSDDVSSAMNQNDDHDFVEESEQNGQEESTVANDIEVSAEGAFTPVEEQLPDLAPELSYDHETAPVDDVVEEHATEEMPTSPHAGETMAEETTQPAVDEQGDHLDAQTNHKDQATSEPLAGQIVAEETEPGIEEGDRDADDQESRATAASIGSTLARAALIPTRAEMEKGDFTFEPYHTIDYFASQGIKLQQSDLSRDKFGKQLKSFTEWLKSMKRLPQAVAEANMDEATQQSIQRIAEHSFEEKDIVTETMAEVWIKQGNKQKAIDTLLKLSLLNPSKSHYFAAKIEQLKAS